ncbi:MAG: hypothetical protein WAK96_00705 [Desulfobaccales bacterium]
MKSGKTRLGQLLVARGLAQGRAQAEALILAGRVQVEGVAAPKAGAWCRRLPLLSRYREMVITASPHFTTRLVER